MTAGSLPPANNALVDDDAPPPGEVELEVSPNLLHFQVFVSESYLLQSHQGQALLLH